MKATDYGFSRPMVHPSLKTWQSNIFVEYGDYTISFSGDDGNSGKDRDTSSRHYLMITKGEFDITEKLGFDNYGNSIEDFFSAREKVLKLNQ